MIDAIVLSSGFIVLVSCFVIGAIGAVLLRKHDALANIWSSFLAIVGSLCGILFSFLALGFSQVTSFTLGSFISPLVSISFTIDKLSVFFIFVISLVALFCSLYGIGYVKHFYKKYSIGALGFFYNLFIVGMLLVVTASNGLFFLIAWEIMSVASYFLVIYDRNDQKNVKAGFLYLVMTHIGTAFIILAFLLLYKFTGSFDFNSIRLGSALIPAYIKDIVFVLAMIGFGTKAGIIPLHIWLPVAHPAAPSHVSGLMSGVMIKTGVYMMIRIFVDILQPVPVWWGLVILVVGSVSALLGVLYALAERDIKQLLAYSSIENIGIILLGVGSSLAFLSLGMPTFALIGLVAALFHTLNHAVFKSILFLSAGSVINQTHTGNMEEHGGLIRHMPQTAFFFLMGSMAISALPPFNGFFSEWLIFQTLFKGMMEINFSAKWIFMASAGALAFTGGLALACFIKAFGSIFLARPRGSKARQAKESSYSLRMGMGGLAAGALLLGIFSANVMSILDRVVRDLSVFQLTPSFISVSPSQSLSSENISLVSAPVLFVSFIVTFIGILLATKYGVYKNQKVHLGTTWDCGTDLTPGMEITPTGLTRSIVTVFKGVLKPSIQHEIEYHDAESRYLPKSRTVILTLDDMYQVYLYIPLRNFITALSERAKEIQSGNINVYIMYIFIALLSSLFLLR
ncbi:MAG: proton-conducting transporter membrane subunit [Patescibacteria group bacterium]